MCSLESIRQRLQQLRDEFSDSDSEGDGYKSESAGDDSHLNENKADSERNCSTNSPDRDCADAEEVDEDESIHTENTFLMMQRQQYKKVLASRPSTSNCTAVLFKTPQQVLCDSASFSSRKECTHPLGRNSCEPILLQCQSISEDHPFTYPVPARHEFPGVVNHSGRSTGESSSMLNASHSSLRNLVPAVPDSKSHETSLSGYSNVSMSLSLPPDQSINGRIADVINKTNRTEFRENVPSLHSLPFNKTLSTSKGGESGYVSGPTHYQIPQTLPVVQPHSDQCEALPVTSGALSKNDVIVVKQKCYRVLNQLGKGGSSVVYQVYDDDAKMCLAVKCVNLEEADECIVNAYRNEINLLSQLQNSSRVIKMFDYEYVERDRKLYVLMEKADTDLAHFFKARQPMDKEQRQKMIAYYWSEMIQAVQVVHDRGIVHSDLKPSNFVLVAGNLKLIDFGIANAVPANKTSVTQDCQMGTMNYMSPEAVQGTSESHYKIGQKSDIWSLGCILYFMVYGKTPFQHVTNVIGKALQITSDSYPIQFPDIYGDKELLDVLQCCLKRNPKLRPTIAELLSHPYLKNSRLKSNPANFSDAVLQSLVASVTSSSPRTAVRTLKRVLQQQ